MYKSSITTLAALSVGVLLVSLSGERTAPTGARDSLEPARSATTASSLVLDAARIEVHGRASIDADLDPAPRRSELLAQLGDACEGRDLEALEGIISAWLERSPDPVGGALELLDGLAEREPEAEGVGLLLQGCMLLATSLPAEGDAWTREALSAEILARADASPWAARAVRLAIAPFAAEVPPAEVAAFLRESGSEELLHTEDATMIDRLFLLETLALEGGAALDGVLLDELVTERGNANGRQLAASALMRRDWRAGAAAILRELGEKGDGLKSGERDQVLAALGGGFLDLHGRDRLELLREVVDDERTTRIALANLDADRAAEMAVFANDADRSWDGYAWVELALGGQRGYEAGLELLASMESMDDPQAGYYSACVLRKLVTSDQGAAALQEHLDRRFENRAAAADPYWGTLLAMSDALDESVVYGEVLPRIEVTRGEPSASRRILLDQLDRRFPDLGLASL
jgi:hypothetical protein